MLDVPLLLAAALAASIPITTAWAIRLLLRERPDSSLAEAASSLAMAIRPRRR